MLELKNIYKKFDQRVILDHISLQFPDTGLIGIQGESGCGKSTLLSIIGMLDDQFLGDIYYNDEKITDKKAFLREHISFMMQNKDIINALTVKENILLASQVSQIPISRSYLKKITHQLQIQDLLSSYPTQLSGGQLKRVSIAKALMKQSSIILCDEPTGALHHQQSHEVMQILKTISQQSLIIIVSHDPLLLQTYCDSVLTLQDGKVKGKMMLSESHIGLPKKKQWYSLIHYPIRELLFQRNKLLFLFLFQWILIVAFFLMTTTMNGLLDALSLSEKHAVQAHMFTIEQDHSIFTQLPDIKYSTVDYHYDLDQLTLSCDHQSIEASLQFLPNSTQHILLEKGTFPKNSNEIIVSHSLYQSLKEKTIQISFGDYKKDFKIVGVLSPMLFQEKEIYCLDVLKDELFFLRNEYLLDIETQSSKTKEIYHKLSQKYTAYSDVLERIENYQTIVSLAKFVGYVFIGVSFIVSLLLIGIVESILYLERKHDVAYLLSLGLKKQHLFFLSFIEALILAMIMTLGGCFFSGIIYWYLNHVVEIQNYFCFRLQLHVYIFTRYDLFGFIFIVYVMIVIFGTMLPMFQMMKIDMIKVLREE